MSQIVLYFIHSTSVLSFYIDVVLILSIIHWPRNIAIFIPISRGTAMWYRTTDRAIWLVELLIRNAWVLARHWTNTWISNLLHTSVEWCNTWPKYAGAVLSKFSVLNSLLPICSNYYWHITFYTAFSDYKLPCFDYRIHNNNTNSTWKGRFW